jgi:hypothetical protein
VDGSDVQALSYSWNDGVNDPIRTFTASGTYTISVELLNGCTVTDQIQITINPNPVVNLGPNVVVCLGDEVTIDAGVPNATYEWRNQNNQILGTNQTLKVTQTGNYTVSVTANGCTATGSKLVETGIGPELSFNGPEVVSAGSTANYSTLAQDDKKWFVVGGTILGSNTLPQIEVQWSATPGIGIVKLVGFSSLGCPSDTTYLEVTKQPGTFRTTEQNELQSFQIYPNPTADFVQLEAVLNQTAEVSWNVVDATGRVLISGSEKSQSGNWKTQISLENLPSGLYQLHISVGETRVVRGIAKTK